MSSIEEKLYGLADKAYNKIDGPFSLVIHGPKYVTVELYTRIMYGTRDIVSQKRDELDSKIKENENLEKQIKELTQVLKSERLRAIEEVNSIYISLNTNRELQKFLEFFYNILNLVYLNV